MLESLNLSNNKLTSLKKIETLPNLREVNASNNQITSLHPELLDMYSLDTLYLYGNPIVNSYPSLAKIENNVITLKKALDAYFGGSGSSNISSVVGGISSSIGTNYDISSGSNSNNNKN